jgi:hypothetical protein
MYNGRDFEELSMIPLSKWSMEELSFHHYIMSQLSPYMNQQGIAAHHEVIREIERRGGLAATEKEHH